MDRREFLATSPAFFAALALGAKSAGALPVGFPGEAYIECKDIWMQFAENRWTFARVQCSNKQVIEYVSNANFPFAVMGKKQPSWLVQYRRIHKDMLG